MIVSVFTYFITNLLGVIATANNSAVGVGRDRSEREGKLTRFPLALGKQLDFIM